MNLRKKRPSITRKAQFLKQVKKQNDIIVMCTNSILYECLHELKVRNSDAAFFFAPHIEPYAELDSKLPIATTQSSIDLRDKPASLPEIVCIY